MNQYYLEFREHHFGDIVDFLDGDEEATVDNYFEEAEVDWDVVLKFQTISDRIAQELNVDPNEMRIDWLAKVRGDIVKVIKKKLKNDVADHGAYYDLATRIK